MKSASKAPFRIALYGMDSRSYKTMEMYLKGPCHGIAMVVDEQEAEIDMLDADCINAKEILENRKSLTPNRPIILLSLQTLQIDKTFFIRKPVNVTQIEEVLGKIKPLIRGSQKTSPTISKPDPTAPTVLATPSKQAPEDVSAIPAKTRIEVYVKKSAGTKNIDAEERQKTAKHQSAMQLNEGGFTAFLGILSDIDFNNIEQLSTACFDPRLYFLGYVQSAYKTARLQNCVLQLNSIWKPLLIFSENREIWLDADDKQLRAFSGITLNKTSSKMALIAAKPEQTVNLNPEKFQDMQAFIWKLAIWTSKGRFPIGLDIQQPVYLESWPNFTRLVITPYALRITALLVQAPRRPIDIPSLMNIQPQYVFVFMSACHTLGLLKQSERQVDVLIEAKPIKKNKHEGLLSKILSKLRGAK